MQSFQGICMTGQQRCHKEQSSLALTMWICVFAFSLLVCEHLQMLGKNNAHHPSSCIKKRQIETWHCSTDFRHRSIQRRLTNPSKSAKKVDISEVLCVAKNAPVTSRPEDMEVSFPDLSDYTDADSAAEATGECKIGSLSGEKSMDFYFEALNGLMPPRKRIDFALFFVIFLCVAYLVRSSDADELFGIDDDDLVSNFHESEESKAVRRLQAMYFDMVCRMRPGVPSSPRRGMLQLSDLVGAAEETEPRNVSNPTRLLLLHASPLCVLTRAANGKPAWAPLPRLRIHREISAVEKALSGVLNVEVDVASIHNLRKAVTEAENLWLHLSAHTVNGNALVLEDGCGGTEATSGSSINLAIWW